MQKSCRRQMIVLKNPNSTLIEEAYLVLREPNEPESDDACDILAEANRLIASRCYGLDEVKKRRRYPFFIFGFLSSSAVLSLVYLFFLR